MSARRMMAFDNKENREMKTEIQMKNGIMDLLAKINDGRPTRVVEKIQMSNVEGTTVVFIIGPTNILYPKLSALTETLIVQSQLEFRSFT